MTRQFLLLATLRGAKLGLAVVSLILYGRLFGIGLQMDAWVFASGVVAAAGMLVWGPVNEIARSRFLRHATHDNFAAAAQGATQLLRFTTLGSALIAFLLWFAGPWLLRALYSGELPDGELLVLRVFTLMLPSLVLGQILSLGVAYLNCCDVIYAPEWIGVGAALASLSSVPALAPMLGIYAIVAAHYINLMLSVGFVLALLLKRRFLGGPWSRHTNSSVRDYLEFSAPLYLSYGAGQANGLLEKALASSTGTGVLTSVNYASQIKSTLQAVLTSVLFSLAVPRLTQATSAGTGWPAFAIAWREVQRVVLLYLLVVLPPVWGGADLITTVLFGTARVGVDQMDLVASLIRYYLVALVPVALYLVHGAALLAQQKGRSYAVSGVVAQMISAACCLALLRTYGPQMFPLALLVSHGVVAVAMARAVGPSRQLWAELIGWLVVLALAGTLMRVLANWALIYIESPVVALMLIAGVHGAVVGAGLLWHKLRWMRHV